MSKGAILEKRYRPSAHSRYCQDCERWAHLIEWNSGRNSPHQRKNYKNNNEWCRTTWDGKWFCRIQRIQGVTPRKREPVIMKLITSKKMLSVFPNKRTERIIDSAKIKSGSCITPKRKLHHCGLRIWLISANPKIAFNPTKSQWFRECGSRCDA